MKKVYIKNNIDERGFGSCFSSEQEMENWINSCKKNNSWGKPERWLSIAQMEEYEKLITPIEFRAKAKGREEDEEVIEYHLPTDYTIEIIDLDQDYDYLLSERNRKVRAEMPTMDEVAEAIFEKFAENRSEKFEALQEKRVSVKAKYPKPVKA